MGREFNDDPFCVSLHIGNHVLHNCMLDSSDFANVLLSMMKQLGLDISRPYKNICGLNLKAVQVHGMIRI